MKACGVKGAAGNKKSGKARFKAFAFSAFLCL